MEASHTWDDTDDAGEEKASEDAEIDGEERGGDREAPMAMSAERR